MDGLVTAAAVLVAILTIAWLVLLALGEERRNRQGGPW